MADSRALRIVLLGDIGIPGPVSLPAEVVAPFEEADLVVANLEGAILTGEERGRLRRRNALALHNAPEVVETLHELGVGCVSLANNHVYDYAAPIAPTRALLEREGIGSFGAGADLRDAVAPFTFEARGTRIQLFGFGWPVIGCRSAGPRTEGANPLTSSHVLATARAARSADPDVVLIFLMHWNYELEVYPQPAHRQLASDLVAAGVDAVIGGHPHVASGIELVAGKPVAYSLGNWLFPHRTTDGFRVAYPPVARRQLAVELDLEGRDVRNVRLRWYHYDPDAETLESRTVEDVGGPTAATLTPYAGLSHPDYVEWFRRHRTRRRGLPVYAEHGALSNHGRDAYLRARRGAGELLTRLGLKREQRGAKNRVAGGGAR